MGKLSNNQEDYEGITDKQSTVINTLPIMGSLRKQGYQPIAQGRVAWIERTPGAYAHRYHQKIKKIFPKCRFCQKIVL